MDAPVLKKTDDRAYQLFGLRAAGELGYLIALPVVLFALAGKWLDGRFGTKPWCVIAGFVLAALLSGTAVYRRAKQLGMQYDALNKEK